MFLFIGVENWEEEGWERRVGGSYDIFYYGIRGFWFRFVRNVREIVKFFFLDCVRYFCL